MEKILKLGVPKGSLENATIELFRKSGWRISVSSRSYFPNVDDEELACRLIRAQEMSWHVESGAIDLGITGIDWIKENESDVVVVQDLVYSKSTLKPARWVLVVKENSPVNKMEDLAGKKISTELVNFTKKYFAEKNVKVEVEFSWGATEAKVVAGLADAIVEVTETGSSLRANNLRIVGEPLLVSTARFITNRAAHADPWKRRKMDDLVLMLRGAIKAEGKVGLKLNVRLTDKERVLGVLKEHPKTSLNSPTISPLTDPDWVALETIIDEDIVRHIMPQLHQAGARGIVEYAINKIIE
jgi:ATP phosphoribosyltransferase